MTNKKTWSLKTFSVLNKFEDLYFPEIFGDIIVFKRENQVCNLYLQLDLHLLIIMRKLSRKLSVGRWLANVIG